jgi:hypothetical protein
MAYFPPNARNGQTHKNFGRRFAYSETTESWTPVSTLASVAEVRVVEQAVEANNTTTYATAVELPLVGNTAGAMAFVQETNRLYLWSGTGWYNVATVTSAGASISGANVSYSLATDGTPTVVTLSQSGLTSPTWSYAVTSGSLGRTATVTQVDNVFTITPSTLAKNVGSFGLTFKATDGSNTIVTSSQFTMSNTAPVIGTGPSATYRLAKDGTPTVITLAATDADGHSITWSYEVVSGSLGGTAVSIVGSVFTITPSVDTNDAGEFQLRFIASDGASFDAEVSSFTLRFLPDWSGATLLHTLDNPNVYGSPQNDNFGRSVITDGTYAVVYCPNSEYEGTVFVYDAASGTLLQTINNPNPHGTGSYDQFGKAVSISGNYLAMGAQGEDVNDVGGTGIVYICNVTTGALVHTINPQSISTQAAFGTSVEISGNTLLVGATGPASPGGTAYIFKTTDGSWTDTTLVHTLNNPNAYGGTNSDFFGNSAAMSGNYCIVGAYVEDDDTGLGSGKAYIFDVTTGALLHTLDNPNPDGVGTNDIFGSQVAMKGNYAVVSGDQEDISGPDSGVVYVFKTTDGSWTDTTLLYTIQNPNAYGTVDGDYFGKSLAMSEEYIIAGGQYEDEAGSDASGKAYIFDLVTGTLLKTLDNPNAYNTPAGDQFGTSVAISGNYVVVGANQEDEPGNSASSGKAYIFQAG